MGPARDRAKSRATLDELLDTLKLLEEEPEPLPRPKAYHKDKYAWIDEVTMGAPPSTQPWAVAPSTQITGCCGCRGTPLGSSCFNQDRNEGQMGPY